MSEEEPKTPPKSKPQNLDGSFNDPNASFHYENLEALEQSLESAAFEFSSPISSISSNASSPDRTVEPSSGYRGDDSGDYVSLEELQSQLSPPADDSEACCSNVKILETIFEDCYLETPPGTPTTPRPKQRKRKSRINLLSQLMVDEDDAKVDDKENVQSNP